MRKGASIEEMEEGVKRSLSLSRKGSIEENEEEEEEEEDYEEEKLEEGEEGSEGQNNELGLTDDLSNLGRELNEEELRRLNRERYSNR